MQNRPRVMGALFENRRDTGPAFTGFVEIDGVKTQICLWPKTSAKGQNYLQVSEDKRPAQPQGQLRNPAFGRSQHPQPQRQQDFLPKNDMDDEIPDDWK